MRKSLAVVLSCVVAAASGAAARGDNSMSPSSMTMMPKNHMYLLGTWQCRVKLAAMDGGPEQTVSSTLTIDVSPSMTLHSHVSSKQYGSDTYQGYDPKTKTHWMALADTLSNAGYETSKDGVVFVGNEWGNSGTIPVRDTQTKISDTKIRDVTEFKIKGKWTQLADITCTKS